VKTDSIFYRLFKTFPWIFFQLIGRSNVDANSYQFVSVELKQTAFRIDGVFSPTVESEEQPVYFLEVQFQPDTTFYRRFFSEIFLYLRQNESVNLWRAVVIYPTRRIETTDTLPYQGLLSSSQVQRIYLDELGDSSDSAIELSILQLIIQNEQTAIQRARELISQTRQALMDEPTRQEILELIETILVYKFKQFNREEIRKMFSLTESEFKQSRIYQSIKQEGIEEGELRGKIAAVPRLLALGLSVEQIASALDLTVEQVQQAAQDQSSSGD
jgi:predicted transposase/invertase (TIGR01784 family)